MANLGPSAWYCDSVAWTAVTAWAAGAAITAGALRRQNATPTVGNERVFVAIVGGNTHATTEPTWSVTKGAQTSDNTVTWEECTGQPGVNGDHAGATTAATSAATSSGAVLTFSSVPSNVAVGQLVVDKTATTVIPGGTTVLSFTSTTVTLSASVTGAGVGNGDTIAFTNCPTWQMEKNLALSRGMIIQNGTGTHLFIVSTAGTTGNGSEPTWNTTAGNTTADNTVTWTCIGAVGSFTGWRAPFARLQSAVTTNWMAAGDTCFVGDDHAETQAAAETVTLPNSATTTTKILCVDHTTTLPAGPSNYKTTATVTTTGNNALTINGAGEVYGITLSAGSGAVAAGLTVGSSGLGTYFVMDSCALVKAGTASGFITVGAANSTVYLNNTTVKFGNTADFIAPVGQMYWTNTASAIQGATIPTTLISVSSVIPICLLDGLDISALSSGTLFSNGGQAGFYICQNCRISSAMVLGQPASGRNASYQLIVSDSAATNYRAELWNGNGSQVTETTLIRTGGASNGTTSYSWKIVTTASNVRWFTPFQAMQIGIWNATTAANVTVTLYGMWNAAALPLNDDTWFDVEYLGSSATPVASFGTGTKSNALASGTALTADTSAWDSLVTARANTTAYSVGNTIKVASNPGRVFFCTTAGTSAGSEPGGYASAVDGGSVTDNTAVFRAATRFKLAVTLSSPQPQLAGDLFAIIKAAKASSTFYWDPLIVLS